MVLFLVVARSAKAEESQNGHDHDDQADDIDDLIHEAVPEIAPRCAAIEPLRLRAF
jgi:hypothetical protein